MNAVELLTPDGKPSGVMACGKCGLISSGCSLRHGADDVMRDHLRRLADRCCAPRKCDDCGGAYGSSVFLVCDACRAKRSAKQAAERFEKAQKLTPEEWAASDAGECMLYDEPKDKWFRDLDDAAEWYGEDEDRVRPAYLWCTTPVTWRPDASGDIKDRMLDYYSEDASDDVPEDEWNRLDEFVDAWWEKQGVKSFDVDYRRCVLLPAPEAKP